ncbi:ketoacyl-ACP synthase III family protein [Streptomyces sp. NPDC052051]|uniref:ketoacyl-ACP synthase III family protein n=1 Tax=Streptomyces sp. NPDC052051 TaxID=3154649 RepID=UPI003413C14D
MRVEDIFLAGIATHLPERVTTEEAVRQGWYDADQRETSGMLSVAVGGDMPAPDMAVEAGRRALERSGHRPDEIVGLLHSPVHHQGPEGWSAAHYILHQTVDQPVMALEIRQGCLGMLTSVRLAASLLTSLPEPAAVLLTAADNFSTPNVDRWRASTHYLLADGGSAVVLSRRAGFARLLAVGNVSAPEAEILHRAGEPMFPPGLTVGRKLDIEARAQYWQEQWAQGIAPPTFHLGDLVVAAAKSTLDDAGLDLSDVSRVVASGVAYPHVTQGILEPLGIPEARSTWEFARRLGHAGGTDQIAGLEHLLERGELSPGDRVLLVSVTVGMEVGCAVIEIERMP